jgi:hypothetical protein
LKIAPLGVETNNPLICQQTNPLCKEFPWWLMEPLHHATFMASSNAKVLPSVIIIFTEFSSTFFFL